VEPKCENCRFWNEEFGSSGGLCRAKSPRLVMKQVDDDIDPEDRDCAVWPVTEPDDWCGDHQFHPKSSVMDLALMGVGAVSTAALITVIAWWLVDLLFRLE